MTRKSGEEREHEPTGEDGEGEGMEILYACIHYLVAPFGFIFTYIFYVSGGGEGSDKHETKILSALFFGLGLPPPPHGEQNGNEMGEGEAQAANKAAKVLKDTAGREETSIKGRQAGRDKQQTRTKSTKRKENAYMGPIDRERRLARRFVFLLFCFLSFRWRLPIETLRGSRWSRKKPRSLVSCALARVTCAYARKKDRQPRVRRARAGGVERRAASPTLVCRPGWSEEMVRGG